MKLANALKKDRISKGRVELNLKEVYIHNLKTILKFKHIYIKKNYEKKPIKRNQ